MTAPEPVVLEGDLFYHPNIGEPFPKVVIAIRGPAAPTGMFLEVIEAEKPKLRQQVFQFIKEVKLLFKRCGKPATIISFPLAANKVAFAAGTPPSTLKLAAANASVVIPLLKGLYDGKGILLITTEVSDKAMKDQIVNFTGFPINYAANLTVPRHRKSMDFQEWYQRFWAHGLPSKRG
jgi:hypothetical protein